MKLTIENSGPVTDLDGVPVRAWRVVDGAPPGTIVYVHRVAVPPGADATAFERELAAQAAPHLDPSHAISTRML